MRIIPFVSVVLSILSCNTREQEVIYWTDKIKTSILKKSDQVPDSVLKTIIRSGKELIAPYKDGKPLKVIQIDPLTGDTLTIHYLSGDYSFFNYSKRFCGFLKGESDEILTYKARPIGLHRIYYCNGNLKRQGIEFEGPVGVWTEYDTSGKQLKEVDYGHKEKIDQLLKIQYGG